MPHTSDKLFVDPKKVYPLPKTFDLSRHVATILTMVAQVKEQEGDAAARSLSELVRAISLNRAELTAVPPKQPVSVRARPATDKTKEAFQHSLGGTLGQTSDPTRTFGN